MNRVQHPLIEQHWFDLGLEHLHGCFLVYHLDGSNLFVDLYLEIDLGIVGHRIMVGLVNVVYQPIDLVVEFDQVLEHFVVTSIGLVIWHLVVRNLVVDHHSIMVE
ncbi:hypothetical protein WICMUC_003552 [Wickerhamomyces mucosus]|uniref:Uncharacterized protein n=1 Tax=Wickerhamomyces mucosus TaxID=1378264 RepID=A0A9P8PLW4_9ASCO|nr:hypothetical protein WICMUC_003552 [Wickerhamomyces mucosus]